MLANQLVRLAMSMNTYSVQLGAFHFIVLICTKFHRMEAAEKVHSDNPPDIGVAKWYVTNSIRFTPELDVLAPFCI